MAKSVSKETTHMSASPPPASDAASSASIAAATTGDAATGSTSALPSPPFAPDVSTSMPASTAAATELV